MTRTIEIVFAVIGAIIFLCLIVQLNTVPNAIKSSYVLGATIGLVPVAAVLRLNKRKRYQRSTRTEQ